MPRGGQSKPYSKIGRVKPRRMPQTGNIKGQIQQKIRKKYRTFGFGK